MTIKVVIADDSTFLRNVISRIISDNENIEVVDFAKNGKQAIEKVITYQPDVLLLDLMMPEMNGLDALKVIINECPTPTIILSAINPKMMNASMQALLMGAFDYIIKPGGLGAQEMPLFKNQLVEKVILASHSRIKTVFTKNDENLVFLRQRVVNETFNFGKYLNEMKPIEEASVISKKEIAKPIQEKLPQKTKIVKIEEVEEGFKKKKKPTKSLQDKNQLNITANQTKKLGKKARNLQKQPFTKQTAKSISSNPSTKKTISAQRKLSSSKSKIKSLKTLSLEELEPTKNVSVKSKVVVIGASVGGPRTIKNILMDIPGNFQSPILIIQHLTDHFIDVFCKSLNDEAQIKFAIPKNGDSLEPGVAYIAPGGFHMEIDISNNKPYIKIHKGVPINYCMPSIDALFISAAKIYKNKVLGILLTGMGEDGVRGLGVIQKFGGKTISESKETCVLYGMPKFAAERGFSDEILPNYKISEKIIKFG